MRCKKHCTDLSSINGVCASCLRQSLLSLIAAQEQAQTICNLDAHPVFPRSVSPYISRRKTDNFVSTTNNQGLSDPDQRFFCTPQVAPTTGSYNPCRKKKLRFIKLSLLTKLFRSKKRNKDSDRRSSISVSDHPGAGGADDNVTSMTSSPFWFPNIMPGGGCRKKQPICSFTETSTGSYASVMRKQFCPDRGMSPVRLSDCSDAEDEFYGSDVYETCESRKQTPTHYSVRRGGGGYRKNGSGMTFWLSPLVRASPCRRWNQKGVAPVDVGDFRDHLSNAKAFCANRSRKVADFGRSPRNR